MGKRLVYYGNETLKRVAEEITNIDGAVIELIDSMFNVMYKERGLGLAAPQVDISKRIITIDVEDHGGPVVALINPVIKEFSDAVEPYDEGCLSLPGISKEIIRPSEVLATGIDRDGREIEFEASGILARALQHEVDHLNGILFIDRLEEHERNEIRPELKKIKKLNKQNVKL